MAQLLSPITLFPVRAETPVFTRSDFKMALSFPLIGSTATTTLKFINNVRM